VDPQRTTCGRLLNTWQQSRTEHIVAEFERKWESEYVKIVQQTQEKDWDVHHAEE
jgi:hypothetical protein